MVSDEHLVRDTRRQREQMGGDEEDQEEVMDKGMKGSASTKDWDPTHGTFLSRYAFWKHPHPLMR